MIGAGPGGVDLDMRVAEKEENDQASRKSWTTRVQAPSPVWDQLPAGDWCCRASLYFWSGWIRI